MSENRPPSDEIDDLDVSRKIADTTASTSISDRMTAAEQRLFISSREQQYLTEFRLGIIRLLTITLLYLIHLVSYLSAAEATTADTRFHLLATIVTLAWLVFGSIVLGALTLRSFPIWLGLATTVVDLVFVLAIAAMGNGARSPLVAVLFLLIIAAALRFDLRAIWVTTCGVVIGYVYLLAVGDPGSWFDSEHALPPSNQLMMLATLAIAGVLSGQLVRRSRAVWLAALSQ